MMWKMLALPMRDNMFDFPGIPCRGSESAFEQCYLRAYAKAYTSLRGLRGVPSRSQVSFQVPTYAGKR